MSTEPSIEELRARAINGLDSYKTGYRHGIEESAQELGLAQLTIAQLKTRLYNQDEHIERLEKTIFRTGGGPTDPDAITNPNSLGYRPACCDGGKPGSVCCDFGCAADTELAEMGLK